MRRRILHLDMDAFYASVEVLDDPSLVGRPLLVGGEGPRSVVCACSYEARPFGVHSAMPMRMAQEKCPDAICLRPRMERYRTISRSIFEYLGAQTQWVEKMSIDEGYLDISDLVGDDREALEMGRRLRDEIADIHDLTSSVGIAPCKFIAKIASDLKKPRALVLVPEAEVMDFLSPLGVERIPGVGKVGQRKLHAMSVFTIEDLRGLTCEMLASMFGKWGARLHDYARGIDPRPIVTEHERKSQGTEKTFETDLRDLKIMAETLDGQAKKIALALRKEKQAVKTVTVKVKYSDFTQVTRQRSFTRSLSDAGELASVARDLLELTEAGQRAVRLVGVTVSNFIESQAEDELSLFDL